MGYFDCLLDELGCLKLAVSLALFFGIGLSAWFEVLAAQYYCGASNRLSKAN